MESPLESVNKCILKMFDALERFYDPAESLFWLIEQGNKCMHCILCSNFEANLKILSEYCSLMHVYTKKCPS